MIAARCAAYSSCVIVPRSRSSSSRARRSSTVSAVGRVARIFGSSRFFNLAARASVCRLLSRTDHLRRRWRPPERSQQQTGANHDEPAANPDQHSSASLEDARVTARRKLEVLGRTRRLSGVLSPSSVRADLVPP